MMAKTAARGAPGLGHALLAELGAHDRAEQDAPGFALVGEVIDQGLGYGEQAVERGRVVGGERLDHREDAPQLRLQHEVEQLLLAGEVVEEGALVWLSRAQDWPRSAARRSVGPSTASMSAGSFL